MMSPLTEITSRPDLMVPPQAGSRRSPTFMARFETRWIGPQVLRRWLCDDQGAEAG